MKTHIPDARGDKNKGNRQRHITSAGHNAKEIQTTQTKENPTTKIKGRNRQPRKSKGNHNASQKEKGGKPAGIKKGKFKSPEKEEKATEASHQHQRDQNASSRAI